MVKDNMIELIAKLNTDESEKQIVSDLKTIANSINGKTPLAIDCKISDDSLKKIQSQLKNISKSVSISVPITNTNESGEKVLKNISKGAKETSKEINKVTDSLANLDKKYIASFSPIKNGGKIDVDATMQVLKNQLSDFENVAVKGEFGGSPYDLNKLTATIKTAKGEVQTLTFALREAENAFQIVKGSFNDIGTNKVQQEIARFDKELKEFESTHQGFLKGLDEPLNDFKTKLEGLKDEKVSVEVVQKALDSLKASAAEIGSNLKATDASFNIFHNAANKAQNFDNAIKALSLDINGLSESDGKNGLLTSLSESESKISKLKEIESKLGRGLEWSKVYREVSESLQKISNDLKVVQKEEKKTFKTENSIETLKNRIQKTSAALEDWGNKNKKAVSSTKAMSDGLSTYAEKWSNLNERMNELVNKSIMKGGLSESDIETFKHLNEEIATFKKEADAANLTTNAFFRNMRTQLSQVLMQWISLQGAIRVVKSMVNEVISLDDAMINLRKVTDETNESYQEFINSSQKQAAQLHSTTTDVVEQSSEWAKLGYNLKEAQELSRTSMVYSKVGEVDNETAVSDLVTVLKAYNQAADESILIVDKLNDLGNKFATDAKSLGEGISVSASALSMAGNDLDQSLAMLTGGTEITQNARETGNAIKVISLRIRGKFMPPYKEIYMLGL